MAVAKQNPKVSVSDLVDQYIAVNDEYNRLTKLRETLKDSILDKGKSHLKGTVGEIDINTTSYEMLNTAKIKSEMKLDWIKKYSKDVSKTTLVVTRKNNESRKK